MKVIWNSQIVEREEVSIDPEDRGYQFGDGIYEVVRAYNGVFFCLDEHIDRLYSSAQKIEMAIPQTKEEMKSLMNQLLKESGVETGNLYLQVTRGIASPRNHVYPDLSVLPTITGNMTIVPRDAEKIASGITAVTEPDIRWLKCDIKSISLLGNIMAKHEAHKRNADEAILHRDGIVTECSASNAAIVKDGVIYTHPDGNLILPGVTKIVWLKCAEALGIEVREEPFTLNQLAEADEVFCSSTTIEVMPIHTINGEKVNNGKSGEITRQLADAFKQKIEEHCGTV
ncbi:D-amino-acid transaminase [Marinilactibacillus piezotolerans]|uniref:D-amino-acid transaminase n=1 Tax=Marinilactibacillus piezotolerans TaxID=258723 RepID=UPI0009B10FBB|nr:D-amino-acid transaminase [Marinilactibacillus piezotolerans]